MTDLCMMCGKPEPKEGWHISGCHDGDFEFFCSEECWVENADYLRDDAVGTAGQPAELKTRTPRHDATGGE